jgi:hypothetical protein
MCQLTMTVPPSSNSSSNSSSNTTNPPPPRSVPRRQFSRAEVEVLNLVNHPIWVFDVLNKCMWWGNSAACDFWNAKTLDDLTGRNFASDMSETVQKKIWIPWSGSNEMKNGKKWYVCSSIISW